MTCIQYINNCSLLIYTNKDILLTDPCLSSKTFGVPSCIHPSYLTSLAEENKNDFSILISNPDDGYCDDEYLKLFPKDINIIIPKYESDLTLNSPFFIRINRLGFNNIIEINKKQKSLNMRFRTHENGVITIETEDSLIIQSNKKLPFWEDCSTSVNKHIQDYRSKAIHLGYDSKNIILAVQADASQDFISSINHLFIYAINTQIKHMFFYGEDLKEFKSYTFYKDLVKEHLINGINFIDMIPGDTFNFSKVKNFFGKFKYPQETLRHNSLNFYKKSP